MAQRLSWLVVWHHLHNVVARSMHFVTAARSDKVWSQAANQWWLWFLFGVTIAEAGNVGWKCVTLVTAMTGLLSMPLCCCV